MDGKSVSSREMLMTSILNDIDLMVKGLKESKSNQQSQHEAVKKMLVNKSTDQASSTYQLSTLNPPISISSVAAIPVQITSTLATSTKSSHQGKRFRQTSPDSRNLDDDMEEGELDSIEYLKTKIQEQQTSIECLEEALSRLIKLILPEDLR